MDNPQKMNKLAKIKKATAPMLLVDTLFLALFDIPERVAAVSV